ncbi:hypothetical protein KQY27_01585 [Methanobrevibacter sp. TMH8]|uniref:hypothetical protein n=1 Tax=Methanobrevibacter sp. TMH8 TaxID=2848611 RepID=UPI001CCBAC00|nr:hypothetical protein [Methanobrevibacter sp. TMH8]MBZ9570238.1 hypothetical protein [Methanobrevibacter sp. TMH8]
MKIRLNQDHAIAKKIGFIPKYFKLNSKVYMENEKKLYIDYIEVTQKGKKSFKKFLELAHKEGFKIYIPQAPVHLKKIIRQYRLPFDLWVAEDEKLCLDNYAVIHLHWLEIHPDENAEEKYYNEIEDHY